MRKRQRRLVHPTFFRDRIVAYSCLMTSHTARLVDTWKDVEIRDVHRDMMRTLEIAAHRLFNLEIEGNAGIIEKWLTELLNEIHKLASFAFLPGWAAVPALASFAAGQRTAR